MEIMKNKKRRILMYSICGLLLLVSFVGMQFSEEVDWSVLDFIIAAIMLFSVTFVIDLIVHKIHRKSYKIGLLLVIVLAFVLVWAEMAVGVFGSPIAGN